MPQPEPARRPAAALRPRQVWGAGVLVAALALLGIVVVAAEGRPIVGPEASSSLDLGQGWRALVLVMLGLALAFGAVIIVMSLLMQRPRKAAFRQRHTWLVWLAALLLGTLIYLVLRPESGVRPPPEEPAPPAAAASEAPDEAGRPAPHWALLLLGGVVVVALAGAVVATRRLRRGERAPAPGAAARVDVAFQASIDDLEADGDPRTAIVAAYARLLEAFDGCGLGRRPSETPLEHLDRGLAAVAVRPGPARELTDLFLEARFSRHAMGPPERDRALAALRAARADLSAAGPTAPTAPAAVAAAVR